MGRKVEERRDLELIVIAKLLEINNASIVSSQHYGLVMKYQFITLLEQRGGTKEEFKVEEGEVILIVHGAPDLPRSSYHKFGGTLEEFNIGDIHKLRIKRKIPENPSPFDYVIDPYHLEYVGFDRYLCLKVDLIENYD